MTTKQWIWAASTLPAAAAQAFANGSRLPNQVAGSLVFAENPAGNSFVIGRENLEPEQSYVTGSVQDQGPGIPEGLMQKMLQTFTTSKAETGGSGLGLGVVKQIVVQHKGALKITSVVGHGTTVSCALPGKPA
jgi:signal transduction histidine kinase